MGTLRKGTLAGLGGGKPYVNHLTAVSVRKPVTLGEITQLGLLT